MDPILEQILRKTGETRQPNEVAFMHSFTANVMDEIREARPDLFEHAMGGTFSLRSKDLDVILPSPTTIVHGAPFAVGPYTSVILSFHSTEDRLADAVVSAYVPERAAETTGKLVLHFFKAKHARRFCNRARH